jgi:AcrR family transcriptional regulator|tara:strand:+ start:278 stop:949 length:672 start_codon:yes stop_codon:yes gene_type:complete
MAKKARKKAVRPTRKTRGKTRSKTRRKTDVADRIITAALALAAGRGWRRVRLADIADEAGVTLAELRGAFSSKAAIVNGFIRRTDERVLAAGPAEGSSARDRLFDVLMRRFDVLQPDKEAVAMIVRDALCNPLAALCHGPQLLVSMAWMLEAAGLSAAGPAGMLRAKGLALVYLAALRAWLGDDSADKARSMAVLDRGLRQAETVVSVLYPGKQAKTSEKAKA